MYLDIDLGTSGVKVIITDDTDTLIDTRCQKTLLIATFNVGQS